MNSGYIALEGNIGSGKTTLSKKLAAELNARLILEEFVDNPFLASFYENPSRWAFSLEMAFLSDRYHQLQQYATEDLFHHISIADYSIFKSLIFAQNNLNGQELSLYRNLFDIIARSLKQPDKIIYLNRSTETLLDHIKIRNRTYELKIQGSYLEDIQGKYINFFKQNHNIPIVIIDADKYDFLNQRSDFEKLKEVIFQDYPTGLNFGR